MDDEKALHLENLASTTVQESEAGENDNQHQDSLKPSTERQAKVKEHGKKESEGEKNVEKTSHEEQDGKEESSSEKDPSDIWLEVLTEQDIPLGEESSLKNLEMPRRSGWKTVRIFVSSTFLDMFQEREVLIKQIFPDLRIWCESRRLHLVECDLRWGVPEGTTSENTLRICLGEIDRCYNDNRMPFFLNLTSERVGWIPDFKEISEPLINEYRLVYGLSMTEMEIVHAAYRSNNPNSLFMIRKDAFLAEVPSDMKPLFYDTPISPIKVAVLKRMIEERFPNEQIHHYDCMYAGMDANNKPKLEFDPSFRNKVMEFFKKQISRQYPCEQPGDGEDSEELKHRITNEAHKSFMQKRADMVFGRQGITHQIWEYVVKPGTGLPLLITGAAGSGKSSVMAYAVMKAIERRENVFYHFVGAVPRSTDLEHTLNRLLKHMELVRDSRDMPKDLESVASLCCGVLSNESTHPVIIFIDAINQLDSSDISEYSNWLPKKLSPNVRVVLSMIAGTVHAEKLLSRPNKPTLITVEALDLKSRKEIVTKYLAKFNKVLDDAQMKALMDKQYSSSPLWLMIACEELRVYGVDYKKVLDKIKGLADGLPELISQVLDRFETETDKELLLGTLCLLEVSRKGLLESELRAILADVNPAKMEETGNQKNQSSAYREELPAMTYACVNRLLKPFIRPFGDLGEGRLDFYHRTMSKAVRKKYLDVEDGAEDSAECRKWHERLANYFRTVSVHQHERKTEELPTHLIYLGEWEELVDLLCDWDTINDLYRREYASELHGYWAQIPAPYSMCEKYCDLMRNFMNSSADKQLVIKRTVQICHLLRQMGHYDEALKLTSKPQQWLDNDRSLRKNKELEADFYQVIANIMDGKVKSSHVQYRSEIPDQKKQIKYWKKVIDLRERLFKKMNDREQLFMLGVTLNHHSFALCSLGNKKKGGLENFTVKFDMKEATNSADKALKIFKDLKDGGHEADSLLNLGIASEDKSEVQRKYYTDALNLSRKVYGEYHELTGRIYLNLGIHYEEIDQFEEAYDCFYKCYYGQAEVLGPDHIRCQRSRKILCEDKYRKIAKERNDPFVPEPPSFPTRSFPEVYSGACTIL